MRRSSNSYHLALAIIIIVGCFYYSYNRLIPRYQQHRSELALIQHEVKAIDEKMQSLQNSKQTIIDLGDVVDKMLVAVPSDKDAPNLITELEALAIKHRVYIPNISIVDPSDNSATVEMSADSNIVTVSFAANGSFSDLHQFIQSIEKDLRFMSIKNITVSSVGDQVSMSIQLDTYKRAETSLSNTIVPTLNAAAAAGEVIQ